MVRSQVQIIRDAMLKMTWHELESFAEMMEAWRSDSGNKTAPITGALLNTWAQHVELEGDRN